MHSSLSLNYSDLFIALYIICWRSSNDFSLGVARASYLLPPDLRAAVAFLLSAAPGPPADF